MPSVCSQLAFSCRRRPSKPATPSRSGASVKKRLRRVSASSRSSASASRCACSRSCAPPQRFRLLPDLLPLAIELHEHGDLRLQHLGPHRQLDVVHRAQRVAARDAGFEVGERRHEDDRRVRRAGAATDESGGLEAVELRHADVEQDHRELLAQQRAQRFGAGVRGDDAVVAVGEDRFEREQLVGAVVDQQHVDRRRRARLELGAHGALREGSRYRCSQLRSWATRWSASTGLAM